MIRVTRPPMPANIGAFVNPTIRRAGGVRLTRAANEVERAVAFFTDAAHFNGGRWNPSGKFAFTVYKDKQLAVALGSVFGTKCAYCESKFGAVTPGDVEHFRPKSEVDNGDGNVVRGYYWLAAEWTNLLIACRECNTGRIFEIDGEPAPIRLGKLSQFPLSDEQKRYGGPGPGVGDETPFQLLLDPCVDEPSDHLVWDDDGNVREKTDPGGQPSAKGAATIRICALRRGELVIARKETLDFFVRQVSLLRRALEEWSDAVRAGSEATVERQLTVIGDHKVTITTMLRPDHVYVGMLRHWVRREKAAGNLDFLEDCQIDLEAWF